MGRASDRYMLDNAILITASFNGRMSTKIYCIGCLRPCGGRWLTHTLLHLFPAHETCFGISVTALHWRVLIRAELTITIFIEHGHTWQEARLHLICDSGLLVVVRLWDELMVAPNSRLRLGQ